jgi:DNA-binding IclR family transcriptional regulator
MSGIYQLLTEAPQSADELFERYDYTRATMMKTLCLLVRSGKVLRDGDTFRLKPADPPIPLVIQALQNRSALERAWIE